MLVRLTSQPAAVNRQLIDQQHLLVHLFLGEENHLLSNGGGLDPLNTHARNQLADSPHLGVGACPLAVPFFPALFKILLTTIEQLLAFRTGQTVTRSL